MIIFLMKKEKEREGNGEMYKERNVEVYMG